MQKHLFLVLALTFLTGVTIGVYAYFMTRSENPEDTIERPQVETGFEVVATTYGGCERLGCSSLRIGDDGEYTYLQSSQGSYERFEDSLTPRQLEELTALVEATDFEDISETQFVGTCPSEYDGIAYRFTIRRESERYEFDSCRESLDGQEIFLTVVKYFAIMDTTYRTP